jgi:hypothetical protein
MLNPHLGSQKPTGAEYLFAETKRLSNHRRDFHGEGVFGKGFREGFELLFQLFL